MTKIKLDVDSSEELEKVIVDIKYKNHKTVVKEIRLDRDESDSVKEKEKPKEGTQPIKSHGFDPNMMDIVND